MLSIFKFLQTPNAESSILKQDKDQLINNIIATLKTKKEYRKFSKRAENYLNELSSIENRTED